MNLDQPNIQLKKADKITMAVIGVIVVALVAVPVLTWFATITALLATIMENTVYFLGLLGGTALALGWLWENKTSLIYKWKASARNLRRAVARENPIGVMDVAIQRFGKKLENIAQHLATADAARRQNNESIQKLRAKAAEADRLAVAAERGEKSEREIAVHAMQADRCRESAEKLQPMADRFTEIINRLTQAREVAMAAMEDMKNRREIYAIEYQTLTAGNKAISGFKSFFAQNEDLEMLELSIEQVDEQTALYEANIDQFLRDMDPQIARQQLEREAAEQAALDRMRSERKPTLVSSQAAPVKQITGEVVGELPALQPLALPEPINTPRRASR